MIRGSTSLVCSALILVSLLAGDVLVAEDTGPGRTKNPPEKSSVSIERSGKPRDILRANVNFCLEIANKQCLETPDTFNIDAGRIFCHTVIFGAETYLEVKHLWYHNGKLDQVVRLPVKSVQWRTWSMKTLFDGAEGSWKVEIYAGDQKIGQGEFSITANGSLASGSE